MRSVSDFQGPKPLEAEALPDLAATLANFRRFLVIEKGVAQKEECSPFSPQLPDHLPLRVKAPTTRVVVVLLSTALEALCLFVSHFCNDDGYGKT